jgi:hypothetical protein
MKEAANHRTYGHLIGRNWIGIEMQVDAMGARAHYFPEKQSPREFLPNLITPAMAYKDVWVWSGPGDPSQSPGP